MVAPVTRVPPVFVARNVRGDFYSSTCGRFDLYYSEFHKEWIAHDWERGRTWRSDREDCGLWCAEMVMLYPSPEVAAAVKAGAR